MVAVIDHEHFRMKLMYKQKKQIANELKDVKAEKKNFEVCISVSSWIWVISLKISSWTALKLLMQRKCYQSSMSYFMFFMMNDSKGLYRKKENKKIHWQIHYNFVTMTIWSYRNILLCLLRIVPMSLMSQERKQEKALFMEFWIVIL